MCDLGLNEIHSKMNLVPEHVFNHLYQSLLTICNILETLRETMFAIAAKTVKIYF